MGDRYYFQGTNQNYGHGYNNPGYDTRGYNAGYGYDNYYGKNSTQDMLSRHEITQIQDAELSNDTMCRVLTLGEKYALGQNVKYGSYNMSSATGDDLLRLFVREIEIFRLSYQDFVEEHGEYKFPRNLSKKEIKEDIKNWINNAPEESYQYFTALEDIIDGNYNFSLKDEIKKLKAKKKKKINYKEGEKAKNLMNHVPIISHNTKKLAKKAEENYVKDKNYMTSVDLSNRPNQKDLNRLSKDAHYDYEEEDEK